MSFFADSLMPHQLCLPPHALESNLANVLPPSLHTDHDMLTCGQCQMTLPLGDILLFIEHKKMKCQTMLLANGCHDKISDRGGESPAQQGVLHLNQGGEQKQVVEPVEIGIQVTPEEEEQLVEEGRRGEKVEKRMKTPSNGICLKQENTLAGRLHQDTLCDCTVL